MRNILILLITMLCACGPIERKSSLKQKQNLSIVKGVTHDPVFYYGSTFGEYVQILARTGRYNEMVKITSKLDRFKFGDSTLFSFYKKLEFSFPLRLKAYKKENEIYWLLYETEINATRVTVQFPVVIESDSCRLLYSEFLHSN